VTASVPLYQGQDFWVPAFEVRRRGQSRAMPPEIVRDITEVTYSDHIERIDTFQLTLNNWDARRRAFKYSDGDDFLPGVELELSMGYLGRDPLRRMISGSITSMRPSFPASGQPTIAISGQNLLRTLQGEKRAAVYQRMTDSQIAREIGRRLQVTVRTSPEAVAREERYDYVAQKPDRPTILFLLDRARKIGYDLYVDEDARGERFLYFGPSLSVRVLPYRLTYGRSLIDFTPDLDTGDQVDEVHVEGWDSRSKQPIRATVRRRELRVQGVGERGGQGDIDRSFTGVREVITNCPVESEQEARTLATEVGERNAKEMLKGSGSTVGLPDLRAGSAVVIDGLGTRFSGRWFVTSTTHTIGDGGYTTRFECRREEL
jgi:phage protein D